jgi:arylsulfatase A-like enzyme
VWYPGHVPSEVRISQTVSTVGIAATVSDLLGESNPAFDGPPLNWAWEKPATTWPDPVAELEMNPFFANQDADANARLATTANGNMKSLTREQWHLITHDAEGDQLYDWRSDPEEMHDLTGTPEGKTLAQSLKAELYARTSGPGAGERASAK